MYPASLVLVRLAWLTAKSVMAGYHYTCAVLSDDTMKCWGSDYEGILGEQTTFGGTGDYGRDDYIVGDEAGEMAALSIVPPRHRSHSPVYGQDSQCVLHVRGTRRRLPQVLGW